MGVGERRGSGGTGTSCGSRLRESGDEDGKEDGPREWDLEEWGSESWV